MSQKKTKFSRPQRPKRAASTREKRIADSAAEVPCGPIPESFRMTRGEQLKSISVPIRLRILEAMAAKPMTTKQVALDLGEPITGLYRHVDALASEGLLVLVAEVPKRGTMQKFYRAAAQRFIADDTCLPRGEHADPKVDTILRLIESVRNNVLQGNAAQFNSTETREPPSSTSAASALLDLDADSAERLLETLTAAIQKFKPDKSSAAKSQRMPFRITVFLHPENGS